MAVSANKAKKSAGDTSPPWEKDDDKKDKEDEASKAADSDESSEDDDDEEEDKDKVSKADVEIRLGPNSNVEIAHDEDDADEDDLDDDNDEDAGSTEDDFEDYEKSEASEDEDDKDDEVAKSGAPRAKKPVRISERSLEKALGALNRFVKSQDRDSRKSDLLAKAASGDISEAGRRELYTLLGGAAAPTRKISREIRKSFKESDEMKKSIHSAGDADVTEYLQQHNDRVCKALTVLAKSVEALSERQYNVNLALAKGIGQTGGGVLSICKRLQTIEAQPARQPKSISARPVNKSFAGEQPAEQGNNTAELVETLTAMNRQSHATGLGGLSKSRHSISDSISSLLSSGSLPRGIMPDIAEFRKSLRKGA